jgi:iron only hydrogenase large subunit-like protein/nitrogen-specific signal transduction histidine kinase
MNHPQPIPLVTTIKERCRVCYTCVRECPAKAIRISTGQAEVIPERCIGCGNCVRVCSQHAKQVLSESEAVRVLLADGGPVAALVAPSFPAEFTDCDERQLVGMLRAMGFEFVNEVAFGADLVADRYARLMASGDRRYIATTCPGVIGYVEKYFPDLVGSLAPIVSPMVATARALREIHGPALRTVFIGPCIAKKGEAASRRLGGEVSAALTFTELREMLAAQGLTPDAAAPSDFDPPHGGRGALLPVARGLFQAAGIHEDLVDGQVVAAEGRTNFVDALGEFDTGALDARLLEVLCCHGCIMGAGMSTTLPQFARRSKISRHVQQRMAQVDEVAWQADVDRFKDLDLSRTFGPNDQRVAVPMPDEMAEIMARMGKFKAEDELNCGACGYETCHAHAVAIAKGLAESEMCLPHTIDQLKHAVQDLAVSNDQLATAQEALMQSEKLASMGQLAAGIAHEVNNPLGVVLMYSHLLLEECDKNSRLYEDLSMIVDQSDRCKKIVAGLLHFARQNKVLLQPSDLGDLVERSLRAMPAPDGVTVHVAHALDDRSAEVDRDQVIQVLTNLMSNAYAAMPQGGVLTIRTGGDADEVRLAVSDTGVGIPRENLAKIFEPFFTTKQIGKGTGLGLAVTYGIVKMHRGDIRVESNADPAAGPTGSTFTVTLPRKGRVS